MATFSAADTGHIDNALREGRPVLLAGPRRCGLSLWVARNLARSTGRRTQVARVDMARFATAAAVETELEALTGLHISFATPDSLAALDLDAWLWVFENVHRAPPDLVRQLLAGLLDLESRGPCVVMEGAANFEALLIAAFPAGLTKNPFLAHVSPAPPWRLLSEIEELRRARFPECSELLSPWVADSAQGDLSLAVELFELLPTGVAGCDDAAFLAAVEKVVTRGSVRAQLAKAIGPNPCIEVLKPLLLGRHLRALPPKQLSDGTIKDLYLAGVVDFDSMADGYRIRSPLTGAIIARTTGCAEWPATFEALSQVGARAGVLMAHLGAFELRLRLALSSADATSHAEQVRVQADLAGAAKKAKAALMSADSLTADCKKAIVPLLAQALPEKVTIQQSASGRGWAPGKDMLPFLTVGELIALAEFAKILEGELLEHARTLGKRRNDVAHFRDLSLGAAQELVATTAALLRGVSTTL